MKEVFNFNMNTNMKKIGLYMLGAVVLFTSCDSILNGDPDDSFVKNTYFTSENNVKLFANEFFGEFAGYDGAMTTAANAIEAYEANYYYTCLSDDQASVGSENWYYKNAPATSKIWDGAYTQIRRANTILEQLPNIESMSEAQRNNWEGVARLMRGWHHYKLVRCYGDCYWVYKVLTPADDALMGVRQDRKLVMDNILEDLNFAAANITADKSTTDWSKALANAMKAEICLYEGGYSKYTLKDDTRAAKYYGEVKTACEALFAQGYELHANFKENFNSPDLDGNKEMIFYKKYLWGKMAHSLVDYTCGSTQTIGMSKDAFDAYLGIDGKPCAAGTDRGVAETIEASTGKVNATHAVINISACLAQRDPRLSAQIDEYLFFPGCGYARYGAAEATSSTGYGVFLFDNPVLATDAFGGNTRRQSIGGNDTDAPIYWLALEYLNYAEACAETGDAATAQAYINKLRDRVGMPHVETTIAAAGTSVLDEVRRERRVEMMFCKNDRYWSLIRWNQLEKLDTQKHPDVNRGAYVQGLLPDSVKLGVTVDADGYINCTGERLYDAKHNLFPIPSGQRTLNQNIGQNPGW